jgi:diguanylate cyclase (GGDEF)-like protein/PAS domain S-box-containing protein
MTADYPHYQYAQWLHAMLEAVLLVDEHSLQIIFANDAASKLLKTPVDNLLGMPVLQLASTPQDQCFWSDTASLMQAGIHTLTSVMCGDGNMRTVEQRVSYVPLESGRSAYLISLLDNSAQESSEQELETLLSELRATLDSAADGIMVCGLDGAVRAFNQRLVQLWDIPAGLLTQRNDAAIFEHMEGLAKDPLVLDIPFRTKIDDDFSQPLTAVVALKTGTVIEVRVVPQISRGFLAGKVFSFRDITRQAEVQASLRLAARVFESSLDAIFIADQEHRLLRMNPGCIALIGPTASAFEGMPIVDLFGRGSDADLMPMVLGGWEQEGFWEGELWLPREAGTYCAVQLSWVALRDDEGRLMQSVGFMRDLTAQHAAQKRIEELAYSDVLTGLPNRLLLAQRVDTALAASRATNLNFAILFLDLDRFKIVNDSLGHLFGDRVLQLVAERLQTSLRQTDMLCRLGGDEFVIYLHGANDSVAEHVARRILDDMVQPFTLDAMGFSVQCSVGIALYPQDGQTLDELIKQADTAMYRVKERGRGSYGFYQPQMNADLLSRMKLDHAMRQALSDNRMSVFYQPQVSMSTGKIVGAEALVRWRDPELGSVSPGVFIPLAEESGYIVTLGAWVMEQAVREAALWQKEGHTGVSISVNVSALEFRQPNFVDRVTRLLALYQLPPALLELELTETILLQDAKEMEQRLSVLAHLGVRLAIDDFGTGYSSLGYLKKLPIHKLKIDQSFIRGLPSDQEDVAIVNAIIRMGEAMHITLIAEGVETLDQKELLQEMECEEYQGYLCSPAVPAADFKAMINKQRE